MKISLRIALGLVLLSTVSPLRAEPPPAGLGEEAKYLPNDCQIVGVVRVEQLLGSAAYQQLKKESQQVAKQEEAIAHTLPLPLEQIKQIVFGGGGTGQSEGLFVVRTRADQPRRRGLEQEPGRSVHEGDGRQA